MDFTPVPTERCELQDHATSFLPNDLNCQKSRTSAEQAQYLLGLATLAPVAPSYDASFPEEAVLELPGRELTDVVTLFRWTPKDAPDHTRQDSDNPSLPGWESLSVGVQEDCAYLSTESGQAVCVVNRRVSHAVVELQKLDGLQFKAFAQAGEWRARLKERRAARTGRKDITNIRLKVTIIVLGPEVAADEAARVLAQDQLFLQEPHEELNGRPYINPQSLHIPEIQQRAGYTEELFGPVKNGTADCSLRVLKDDLSGPGLVDLVLNIDEFYNHVPGHDYLQEAYIVGCIRTPLLRHQKIAVDFMLRRESGVSQLCRSLWTARTSDDGLKVFEHVITGAKCRTAQECPGGLIADDAGLGKTLTTLATIVNTLPSAEAFAKLDESRTRATLVVVPFRTSAHDLERRDQENKLDDLGSIVKFLKVPCLENLTVFNKHITRILSQGSSEHGYDNLKQLLGSICLRRNRSIISGPGYCTEVARPEFSQAERENYRSLEFRVRHAVMTAERSTGSKHAHHKIMEALLRLRMFCNTGLEAVSSAAASGASTFSLQPDEILAMLQQAGQAMCFYCSADIESLGDMNAYDSGILTQCSSLVCSDCMSQYHEESKGLSTLRCPICKFEHEVAGLAPKSNDVGTYTRPNFPSKVEALLEDVQNHHLSKKCLNGLTVANRIYIMEPQWNPAVEQQAIGRVLRIDQCQPVTVVSYVMRRSIEEASQNPV
ncbi:hypothetical protein PG997_005936 [Apiospora hydei]|uniref:RING-type domain-containing protein n=1 Tax=Apiospora hydei TaxID=1337664 RepID=A0ABR1WQB6_9PEZI